jgi:hypothetical protein
MLKSSIKFVTPFLHLFCCYCAVFFGLASLVCFNNQKSNKKLCYKHLYNLISI